MFLWWLNWSNSGCECITSLPKTVSSGAAFQLMLSLPRNGWSFLQFLMDLSLTVLAIMVAKYLES